MENYSNEPMNNESEILIDEFIIDEGFSIADDNKEPKAEAKREINLGPLKPIIWILAIFVVSIILALSILSMGSDYIGVGPGKDGEEFIIEIPEGSDLSDIANILKENKVIKHKLLFKIYSKLKDYDEKYHDGAIYVICDDDGYSGIANKLVAAGNRISSVKIRIPERASVDDIIKLLAEKGVGTEAELKKAINEAVYSYEFIEDIPEEKVYYRLEGYLFPDTYEFYNYDDKEECARLAVDKMLSVMEARYDQELRIAAEKRGYSMHEVLTVASIIELEACGGSLEEKQKIAEVFYNRLRRDGTNAKLESDPTTYYPYGDGAYDTYKSKGLPPGPLCSPSLTSIKAAANPSTANPSHYFFVNDKNGRFYFSRTSTEHQNTISKLKKDGLWPEKE